MGQRRAAAALLLAAALALHAAYAQPLAHSIGNSLTFTGVVEVREASFQDGRTTVHAYLRASAPHGSRGAEAPTAVFQLLGPLAGQLRSGQHVNVSGTAGHRDSAEAAAAAAAAAHPRPLHVATVTPLAEPALPAATAAAVELVVEPPASSPAAVLLHGAGRLLAEQQGGALPTVQLLPTEDSLTTLVLPLSFEGCPRPSGDGKYGRPWWTREDVAAVMFEDGSPRSAWTTAGGSFRACSHGQTRLTRANSRVAPVLRIPCTGMTGMRVPYSTQSCGHYDYMGFIEAALTQLRQVAPYIAARRYRHRIAVLPLDNACPWLGMGDVGCYATCSSWVQGDTLMGLKRSNTRVSHTVLSQLGRNLYLNSAGTDKNAVGVAASAEREGNDASCAMGRCCSSRCYNAPHAWQLGWLAPQLLDAHSLRAGQARLVTFSAQSRSKFSGLIINATSWAAGTVPLHISYRLAEGGDTGLERGYTNRVLVHSFAGRTNYDLQPTRLLGVLARGARLAPGGGTGVAITVVRTNPRTGKATVRVARSPRAG